MNEFDITTKGYSMVDRDVKSGQTTGRVFVPKEWMGKKVRVILLEPLEEEDGKKEGVADVTKGQSVDQ